MKNITAILIDDNDTYRYLLAKRLTEISVTIRGSVIHKNLEDLDLRKGKYPLLAFISFTGNVLTTAETIKFVLTYNPETRVIITVSEEYKGSFTADELKIEHVNGIIYKADISLEELQAAILAVKAGKPYFQNPFKKFP